MEVIFSTALNWTPWSHTGGFKTYQMHVLDGYETQHECRQQIQVGKCIKLQPWPSSTELLMRKHLLLEKVGISALITSIGAVSFKPGIAYCHHLSLVSPHSTSLQTTELTWFTPDATKLNNPIHFILSDQSDFISDDRHTHESYTYIYIRENYCFISSFSYCRICVRPGHTPKHFRGSKVPASSQLL